MSNRVTPFVIVALTSLVSANAFAHKNGHEDEKSIPMTCAQLADTKRYTNDTAYPEVRALKAHCESEKKAGTKPKAVPVPQADKKN